MPLRFIGLVPLCWSLLSIPLASPTPAQEPEGATIEAKEDPIETDRDSFTRSPRVVERRRCVLEGSYTFLDQAAEYDGHLYPDLLLRYGAIDWLEIRLGWTYEVGKFHHLLHDYQQHYVGPGAHYLLTPNCEIGARVFWGLNEDSARFICNTGLGFRF